LTHVIFVAFIIDENYYATTYSIATVARNASPSMEKPVSISQLLPLPTDYPLVAGILDLAETCPTRSPTEDESLGCRPFISPQHLWLSHLFGTNYQGRTIL